MATHIGDGEGCILPEKIVESRHIRTDASDTPKLFQTNKAVDTKQQSLGLSRLDTMAESDPLG